MKLLQLSLKNFKGIRGFTLDTQGDNVAVYGDNAIGKTTLWDAFQWLLFDKDSANRKDFDIKTLDETGEAIHGLEHEVEGVFDVDGLEVVLKKVYAEKWTKRRGSATKEFTGHTVDHFIDGVPVKKGEYDKQIADIVDENVFKLLTSPTYFSERLHWQDRRKILLEICGDITDEDVIGSDKSLSKLPDILGSRTIEDHRKVIAARRTEINKELSKIPVRVDEVTLGLPDVPGEDKAQLEKDTATLKGIIREKEQEIARVEEGGEVAERTKQLREIEGELFGIKNNYQANAGKNVIEVQKRLFDAKARSSKAKMAIENAERAIEYSQGVASKLLSQIEVKRGMWHEVNSQEFTFEQGDTCPICGQKLPPGQLKDTREKALADFNMRKAEHLKELSSEGKSLKVRHDELIKEIQEKQGEADAARKDLDLATVEIGDIDSELTRVNESLDDFVGDKFYQEILKEKENIEVSIQELKAGKQQEAERIRQEMVSVQVQLQDTEGKLLDIEKHARGQKRIEELLYQERGLAAEYERLEEELYLTEQFIRTKVGMLEEKINSRFEYARFKLFNVLVNGAVEECCETLYQGVPYNSALNNAARINVGLDIINTLSGHYGFEAPIWIDNREAVTRLIPARAQVISLIVSETDKELRVEHTKEKVKEAV